jgi:hypothetical protein
VKNFVPLVVKQYLDLVKSRIMKEENYNNLYITVIGALIVEIVLFYYFIKNFS